MIQRDSSVSRSAHVSLVIREGSRKILNSTDWINAVNRACKAAGCSWSTIQFAELSFCQQVEAMSTTDILMSVHGAQLTNMIFMNPGSRILEIIPKGWLQLAGHGQFIYKHLADWVGLQHFGFWRDEDESQPVQCPQTLLPPVASASTRTNL